MYEGSFINNKFEGDLGTLYKDGEVLYQGGFRENMYQGIGQLYHDEHYLYQEGSFMNGQLEGEGTVYKEDGNILYTGYSLMVFMINLGFYMMKIIIVFIMLVNLSKGLLKGKGNCWIILVLHIIKGKCMRGVLIIQHF